jgi:hypothetical protein
MCTYVLHTNSDLSSASRALSFGFYRQHHFSSISGKNHSVRLGTTVVVRLYQHAGGYLLGCIWYSPAKEYLAFPLALAGLEWPFGRVSLFSPLGLTTTRLLCGRYGIRWLYPPFDADNIATDCSASKINDGGWHDTTLRGTKPGRRYHNIMWAMKTKWST